MDMENRELLEKKIAIVGVGGVGGYLAAMLTQAFPHVSVVARGARGLAIRNKGLVLHSDYHGEITAKPERIVGNASDLGVQDMVFLCVKNYSLKQACEELKNGVRDRTTVIPVMNGANPGEQTRKYLGRGTVVDSLIYIVSFANSDYSVTQQGEFANLRIGIPGAGEEENKKVQEVSQVLRAADIDHEVSMDIECEIWRKYIMNCAYNVLTAYYDADIGQLRNDPQKAGQYEQLVREAYEVARRKHVAVTEEHIQAIFHRFYEELADDATSSLQRDIRSGHFCELETFSGYIVREAKRLHTSAPLTAQMYEELKKKCFC